MALGSKNRDYKTSERAIQATINVHVRRINELMAADVAHGPASKLAYDEIKQGLHKEAIAAEVKRLMIMRTTK